MIEQRKIIRWQNPPASRGGGGNSSGGKPSAYQDIAADLRAHPGRWAVIFDGAIGLAAQRAADIRQGVSRPFQPAGDFEAVARGRFTYARYVGPVTP